MLQLKRSPIVIRIVVSFLGIRINHGKECNILVFYLLSNLGQEQNFEADVIT